MRTKLLALLMLVVSVLSIVPAMADSGIDNSGSIDYQIENIGVAGQTYTNTVYVERGSSVPVEVYLTGTGNTTDVQIRVWLGGYEYDNVYETSEMFDVEDGVSYKKTLNLELPEDLNAEQEYTLYVEVFDDVDSVTAYSTIMVSAQRHLVSIQDVLVEDAEAGDYVSVTVRLENMGDHKEEDIKVTVSNSELDLETSTYLDELTENEIDNEDEESSGDVTLTFQVSEDAEEGNYDLTILVAYNEGTDTVEETVSFHVDAVEVEEEDSENDSTVTVIVADDESEDEAEEDDFSTALRLGFGILAVLIVILALILIVRR